MRRKRELNPIELAARGNWRVFTLAELLQLGITRRQLRTMVDRGQLHRRHQGVYVYGHPDLSWQGEYLAAQYAGGPGAYLTNGSGLALLKLWRPYTGAIHVTALSHRRNRDKVTFHRRTTAILPGEVRSDGPLRYAAVPRLLLEFGPASNLKQLKKLINKAVQQDKLDHGLMRKMLEQYPRQAALLAQAYDGYLVRPRAKSELEAEFDVRLAARPWLPEPQRNVHVEAGGIRWEIDRLWPEYGVGVEVDSRTYHQALADRTKDEFKRAKLLTVGIQTLGVSDWRIEYGSDEALDDLEVILQRGGWANPHLRRCDHRL